MRYGVMSDTMGAASPAISGHGLGRATWQLATRLLERGHEVILFGLKGSQFAGELVTVDQSGAVSEPELARMAYARRADFDVLLDNTHKHILAGLFPNLPVLNFYHDKWQPHRRCAVLMSEGQRELMSKEFASAKVVHNTVNAADFVPSYRADNPPYAVFLGFIYRWKQPVLAIEAAAAAGLKLYMAGSFWTEDAKDLFHGTENVQFIGAVTPAVRNELLRGASVLLQLGHSESFGLTTIEAGLCGTPVVAWPSGGNLDTVREGVNGIFVGAHYRDKVAGVVEAIHRARALPRKACREFAECQFGNPDKQAAAVEQLAEQVAAGEVW